MSDKTIKELADELGVSKTAINKEIDNLGLRSSLRKNGNRFAVPEASVKLINKAFKERQVQTEIGNQNENGLHSTLLILEEQIARKDKQIESLLEQLKAKDNQINQTMQSLQFEQAKSQKILEKPKKKWWKIWN